MNIAFVGIGSIASRHIRNLIKCLKERHLSYSIDVYRSGFGRPIDDSISTFINNQYDVKEDVRKDYDIVFITNPTSLHFDTLVKFKDHGNFFFIEKPVFDSVDVDLNKLSPIDDDKCYVASPLRYNPVIQYVKSMINNKNIYSCRAICSTFLPNWRPGVDYRSTYSAHKDMGGGVEIDLIHEWDYLSFLFGLPKKVNSIISRKSNLEIDSNDIAIYIAEYNDMLIELHLDYFGRKETRQLQLFTDGDAITCNLLTGEIEFAKDNKIIKLDYERDTFQIAEMNHFLDMVQYGNKSDNTIEHAIKVLKIAKGLE